MSGSDPVAAAIKAKCRAVIDRFPHREALREEDIRDWIGHVVGVHGDAAVWHATRAGGFGGSDIGVLVRNYSNHRADHQNSSAHDIVRGKLLRSVPDDDTGDLRRGHENEPAHTQRFYAKYGAQRDVAAFEALSKAQGQRVWMRYSPDEVALLPSDTPNPELGGAMFRRVLADYKAPRQVAQDDLIAFQYACQLHQGAMICAKAGIHLDALMLSQYDWANWALKDDYVPYDPQLARLILAAGDHYHGYVMRGELPPYIFTPRFEGEAEFIQAHGELGQRLAHVRAAAKAFKEEEEALIAQMKDALDGVRLAGTRMQIGDLGVSVVVKVDNEKVAELLTPAEIASVKKPGSPEYDDKLMAAKLRELDVDLKPFRVNKIDPEKGFELLVAKGHDAEALMSEEIRFKAAKHLEDAARDMVQITFPRPKPVKEGQPDDDQERPTLAAQAAQVIAAAAAPRQPQASAARQASQAPQAPQVSEPVQEIVAAEAVQALDAVDQDVRSGHETERLAPRTANG